MRFKLLLLSSLLAACGGQEVRGTQSSSVADWNSDPRPLGKTLVYECADYEFVARLGPGEMAIWLEDRYMILSQVRAASGVKYQEGDTEFWMKGDEASLKLLILTTPSPRPPIPTLCFSSTFLSGDMFGSTRAATLVQDTLLAGNAAGIAATKQVLTGITAAIRTSVGPLDAMVETMLDPTARLDAYVKERKRTRVG